MLDYFQVKITILVTHKALSKSRSVLLLNMKHILIKYHNFVYPTSPQGDISMCVLIHVYLIPLHIITEIHRVPS